MTTSRQTNTSLKFLITALICLAPTLCCAKNLGKKCSYKEIGTMYMRSFGLDETSTNTTSVDTEENSKRLKPIELTKHEKTALTFNLLAQNETNEEIFEDALLKTALEDLEVFYAAGQNQNNTVFSHIYKNAKTIFGKVVGTKIVANPTTDSVILDNRQAFIKELVDNEELFNELQSLLCQVHVAEDNILSFWKEENHVTKDAIGRLYFTNRYLEKFNNNPIALECLTRFKNLKTSFVIGGDALLYFGIFYALERMKSRDKASLWEAAKAASKSAWSWVNPKAWYKSYTRLYSEEFENQLRDIHWRAGLNTSEDDYVRGVRKFSIVTLGIEGALFSGYSALKTTQIKSAINLATKDKTTQNYLQKRLIDFATLMTSIEQARMIASKNSTMLEALSTLDKSCCLLDGTSENSSETRSLVELLKTRTFENEASFFSLTGRVLSAYQLMSSAKDQLVCLMETVGEIDAYLSIAKLYKESSKLDAHYCFAEYAHSEKPYMKAEGFWNPILDPENAIKNDLVMGGNAIERNAIITGSNTGGKSTSLKSLAINSLLAQTIGLAAADFYCITPFEVITTSLNVKDDTGAGHSLFKAELLRKQHLTNAAENLEDGEFAFYTIDELFTGTAPEKGQQAAYRLAKSLAESDNVIYLWATHYPQLTQLEEDTSGCCKNYKMEAYKDEQTGLVVRPFILEEGISTSNIALELFEEQLA